MSGLRTSLEEGHAEFASQRLPLLRRYDFFLEHVGLVADEYFFHILTSVQLYLTDPILDVGEAFLRGAVVSKDDAHRAFVVGLCDGAEAFLAGGVPNLELNVLSVNLYRFDLKINSYKENITD
jgi:hypothetical protein